MPNVRGTRLGFISLIHYTYLLTGISAAGDDGYSADLEELHFGVSMVRRSRGRSGCGGNNWSLNVLYPRNDLEGSSVGAVCG